MAGREIADQDTRNEITLEMSCMLSSKNTPLIERASPSRLLLILRLWPASRHTRRGMFQIMTGMSKKEWNAQGLTADQRGIPHATPTLDFSDDSGEHSEDAAAHKPRKQQDIIHGKYRRSEQERDRCREHGKWPDGHRVGRGFGQPYLQPEYAEAIASGAKTVEGRINEGVSLQPSPNTSAGAALISRVHLACPSRAPLVCPSQWAAQADADDYVSFKVTGTGFVLAARIKQREEFPSFEAMLANKGVGCLLPGKADVVDAVRVYHSIANRKGQSYEDLEKDKGVVALTVELLGA